MRRRCTRSKKDPRGLTIRTQAFQEALQTRRQSQQTPEFLKVYQQRAGIGFIGEKLARWDDHLAE